MRVASVLVFSCLAVQSLFSYGVAATRKEVKLDVVQLAFYTKQSQDDVDGDYIGGLTLTADLEDNRIQQFRAEVGTGAGGNYKFNAGIDEIRGEVVPLKASGVSIGTLQGLQMNGAGEGTLRFQPNQALLAEGMPQVLDLTLRRVGSKQKWVVFYQGKVLREIRFNVNKNPLTMNVFSLLLSPPKVNAMRASFLGCDGASVATVLLETEAPELLKVPRCDFSKASPEVVADIVGALAGRENVYAIYYLKGGSPTESQEKVVKALKDLKDFGLDLSRYTDAAFSGDRFENDLFHSLIGNGHEMVISDLLNLGLHLQRRSYLDDAFLNLVQVDGNTKNIVNSNQGRRIFDLVQSSVSGSILGAQVMASLLNYPMHATEAEIRFDIDQETKINLAFKMASRLLDLMIEEKADLIAPSEDDETICDIIRSAMDAGQLEESQGQQLIQKVKAAGGR